MVGQLDAVNVGALSSFERSTFNVNWSEPAPLCWSKLQGTATRFPLEDIEVEPSPELLLELELVPLLVELLLPGAPAEVLLSDRIANWICPLAGSTTKSWICPSDSPLWPLMLWCISLLSRVELPICELVLLEVLLELVPYDPDEVPDVPLEDEPDVPLPDFVPLFSSSFATA